MKSRNAAFFVIVLCAQLLFPRLGAGELIARTEGIASAEIVDSLGAVHGLVLATFYRMISEGRILGALLVYDDPKTKRPQDYFEFYDYETNLLAIGQFDRYGIQRIAIGRGLFDGSKLQDLFVTLSNGDAL